MKALYQKNILTTLASLLGVTTESILSHGHKAELVDNRSMIAAVLTEHAHLRQQDVAPLLDVSQAGVSKMLARHRIMMRRPGGDPDYQNRYAEFVKKLAGG